MFGDCGKDLREAIANATKSIWSTVNVKDDSLEAFLACQLVSLDKQPGVRPIGVWEVIWRICGRCRCVQDKKLVVKLQYTQWEESSEVRNEEVEAVLLVDFSNAFNSINRQALLHNTWLVCQAFSTYVTNCYRRPDIKTESHWVVLFVETRRTTKAHDSPVTICSKTLRKQCISHKLFNKTFTAVITKMKLFNPLLWLVEIQKIIAGRWIIFAWTVEQGDHCLILPFC